MTPKTIAIVQSSYIPWKGYFDLIDSVDEFVLFDDVQYTANSWRNRNRIKTASGSQWLTIPVVHSFGQKICDARIAWSGWAQKHWRTINYSYGKAPHFREYHDLLKDLYLGETSEHLSEINARFIRAICEVLGIRTRITWSRDYRLVDGATARLVEICRQAGASVYLSGPTAMDYLEPHLFTAQGIELRYKDYSGYPEYPQLHGAFEHRVSVIDVMMHTGREARQYIKAQPSSAG